MSTRIINSFETTCWPAAASQTTGNIDATLRHYIEVFFSNRWALTQHPMGKVKQVKTHWCQSVSSCFYQFTDIVIWLQLHTEEFVEFQQNARITAKQRKFSLLRFLYWWMLGFFLWTSSPSDVILNRQSSLSFLIFTFMTKSHMMTWKLASGFL